jgi:hypothetical protein
MRLPLLIPLTLLLPLVWGWLMHWLVKVWWPVRPSHANHSPGADAGPSPEDFQI